MRDELIVGCEKLHVFERRQGKGLTNPRQYYTATGTNGPKWRIPNKDIKTVLHAILERVYFVKDKTLGFKRPPRPWTHQSVAHLDDEVGSDELAKEPIERLPSFIAAKTKMNQRFNSIASKLGIIATRTGKDHPISEDKFLSFYGGSKLACYTRAVESLHKKRYEARDSWVKVFTKDEYMKTGGAPRAIQPRSPRFNVMLGRHLKHIEHKIYDAIDEVFDPSGQHRTVAKGMNMIERGNTIAAMWARVSNPVAVGLDASRFDQHINRLLMAHEHSTYHQFAVGKGKDLPSLAYLLSKQLRNHGVYWGKDGTIKYVVEDCRMSGDMNTSSGAVIIMTSLVYAFIEFKGLEGRVQLLNDGDDCVFIMDRSVKEHFCQGLQEWFSEMGITMEFDGVYESLEKIEFCQARPVWTEEHGYRLCPRPSKRLYSDVISTKELRFKKIYERQLGAIAGCGLAGSGGSPIFQSFYQWLGSGANPWIPEEGSIYYKFRQELIDGVNTKCREPTVRERVSFYLAFDISPAAQEMLEDYYRNLPPPLWSTPKKNLQKTLDPTQHLCYPEQKIRW
jgi:hypothetical protein